jgi:hypothetical protein
MQARGRLLSADDLTSAGVMAELNRLFRNDAPGQGFVVC